MALGRGQMCGGCLRAWEVSPHACTCMHTHVYMYKNCKWPATWRHPFLACLSCLTCMCMHVCVCVHGTPPHTHTHPPHPPICHPPRGTPRFSQNLITLELIKIFQFCLKISNLKNSPLMGGCMVWWVGGWVDGWGQVKSLKILKNID